MENLIITGGYSEDGAGIFCRGTTYLNLDNCTIKENNADNYGGGIFCTDKSVLIISDSSLSVNTAYETGGGLYVSEESRVYFNHGRSEGNTSLRGGGGGFGVRKSSKLSVTDSTIIRNVVLETFHGGAGIYAVFGSDLFVENTLFQENMCGNAGAAIMFSGSNIEIAGCRIVMNESGRSGGGISISGSSGRLYSNVISDNTTGSSGGGISIYHTETINIDACIITGNSAENGGGIRVLGSDVSVNNCTISGNSALDQGGGFLNNTDATVNLINSIVWENTASSGSEFYLDGGECTINYCDVKGGMSGVVNDGAQLNWGDQNFDRDPLFMAGNHGEYYLAHQVTGHDQDSPCIDTGGGPAADTCFNKTGGSRCLSTLTTRIDAAPDSGTVDLGGHYNGCLGVTLQMPSDTFREGEICGCTVLVSNPLSQTFTAIPLFVILDVYGSFYFWPGFTLFDYEILDSVPEGETIVDILPPFIWPEVGNSVSGIRWISAMTDPEITELLGVHDVWVFGWEQTL